jgi:DNA-binding beta-propeller fold protein YncE
MPSRSMLADNVPTRGKFDRRDLALAAALFLAIVALALGTLKILHDRSPGAAVALSDVGKFLFVPSRDVAEVTVIDSKSDRVVTRLALAGTPHQVLVSEAAGAMVASFPDRSVLEAIDLSSPAEKAQIDLTMIPEFMVLSPDGYLLAAADGASGSIAVVSLPKRRVLLHLSGFANPGNLTFSLDGSQLYITDGKALELAVVDIVQQAVVSRAALAKLPPSGSSGAGNPGFGASALTRTPDGRYGFVSVADLDSVIVVDLSTLKPVKQLHVGHTPLRPYGTADGRLMLVPNDGDQSVSVIDTAALRVAATLPGAKGVTAINTGWFESLAFVMSRQQRVVVLDLMKFQKLGEIELPGSPGAGVVTSNGQKLYTALSEVDRVAVIDAQAHKLGTLIEGVGRRPSGAILARSNNYCH